MELASSTCKQLNNIEIYIYYHQHEQYINVNFKNIDNDRGISSFNLPIVLQMIPMDRPREREIYGGWQASS